MKKLTVFLILLLISNLTFGQNKETTDKKEIKQILN